MILTPVHRDQDSAEFFAAAAEGRLLVRQCANGHYLGIGHRLAPTPLICPTCGTSELAWTQASGKAVLISWTVMHERDGTPTGVAGIVELEEGAWMCALLDVPPTAELLHVGQAYIVGFVASGEDGEVIPVFKPV